MKSFIIVLIILTIFGGVGFFLYKGALNQEQALVSEIPLITPPAPTTEESHAMDGALVEIGAEDKMVPVPEGAIGAKKEPAAPSESDSIIEARPLKEFTITSKNFAFSETEIRVKKGDFVRVTLKSIDGFHDWVVDAFKAKTDRISTGNSASVDFVADESGTFEFYCSVGNHRQMGMVGKLIVEE